ncbi:unnamed protein product [Blepharisma stoltei]|uniref:Uncharacterized protein n=1 Tax=Blepharisma stoltei TaxID=1481888 RepID=A0AAU9I9D4_9CILI|nr:unnamed protein product [Blepharisma stoltei]
MENSHYLYQSESQKIKKVVISESESISPYCESPISPNKSSSDLMLLNDLKYMIELIQTTLSRSSVIFQPPHLRSNDIRATLNSLKYLTETLCDEFLVLIKRPLKESSEVTSPTIASIPKNDELLFYTEKLRIFPNSQDLIQKIAKSPHEVLLSQQDCEDLTKILLTSIRNFKEISYKDKYKEMAEKAIIYGKLLSDLRKQVRLKEEHIEILEENIRKNCNNIANIVDYAKHRQNLINF